VQDEQNQSESFNKYNPSDEVKANHTYKLQVKKYQVCMHVFLIMEIYSLKNNIQLT